MRTCAYFASMLAVALVVPSLAWAADAESLPSREKLQRPIAEKCLKDIQSFEQQLWRVGFGILPYTAPMPREAAQFYMSGIAATPRKKLLALREAAYVYALDGEERSCQQTLSAMRAVYEDHQKLLGKEANDPDVKIAWRRAHLARSKPIAEMGHLMRAGILIGSELRNLKDERLGEVQDIVLNPEKRDILYILASRGGFLGFGEKLTAVRWTDLRATEDHQLFVLDVTPKAFADAPDVDRQTFAATAKTEWRRALDRYWEKVVK